MIYGYGRGKLHWSNRLQDGPYRLFALDRGKGTQPWAKPVAITVRAMVLAGKVLFAAGPTTGAGDAPDARGGKPGALLLAVSAADGTELARYPLASSPVFDGMAAARGRLYLSLESGDLVCMGEKAAE